MRHSGRNVTHSLAVNAETMSSLRGLSGLSGTSAPHDNPAQMLRHGRRADRRRPSGLDHESGSDRAGELSTGQARHARCSSIPASPSQGVEMLRKTGTSFAALVAASLLVLTACSTGTATGASNDASGGAGGTVTVGTSGVQGDIGDIAEFCGDQPIKVAFADGFGGNSWRKTTRAIFEAEAAKCANITEVIYTDAQADTQKAIADINSLVAQGVERHRVVHRRRRGAAAHQSRRPPRRASSSSRSSLAPAASPVSTTSTASRRTSTPTATASRSGRSTRWAARATSS